MQAEQQQAPASAGALRTVVCALVAASQVAACAKGPDSIEAKYVSPHQYQNWSCDQLTEERIRLTKEVDRVGGLQRENANADTAMMAVGLIIFWPALIGLAATKDRKEELGRLKGEYEAVDSSLKGKACTLPPPGPVVAAVAPTTPVATAVATAAPPPAAPAPVATASMDGTYKGPGKTDSWCLTPTLNVAVKGSAIEGELSEGSGAKATSSVRGTVHPNGVISLDFKGNDDKYFSGKVDGTLKDDMLSVSFRSKAASACRMEFALKKE
ncbi:MAG: hypothetical protein JSS04_05930 [Proteobacteria bacterium]|nr:hypothetical protein [Pseudomonadota bacterium]